ncbi:MAG: hypothetical protein Q9175_005359, partial [Cornicularia normoerica]
GIPMDRVAKVVSTAAFHDRERETDPMALETAETLVVEANCLHLSPFTYCVDDATVPDTHLRTIIATKWTFQVREQYEKLRFPLVRTCQPNQSLEPEPPNHDGYEVIIKESYVEGIVNGEAFKHSSLTDKFSQLDEVATCTATEKKSETAVQGIVHIGSEEHIF